MNREEKLSRRRELYRLRRQRDNIARQRKYMRHRHGVLTDQQREQNLQRRRQN